MPGLEGRKLGSYRVMQRIGEGGMGAVYLAEHVDIGRRAALKVLRSELAHHAEQAARFLDEARATNRIGHSGIVDIYDCGSDPQVGLYLVMELLDGETLSSRLRREPEPALSWVADITRQIARALDAAHAVGVVHRDLKPDNIFIVKDDEQRDRVKILDFGIAKLVSGGAAQTRTGQVLGTPLYMSPEQCHGAREVDARGDVYSLGAVIYCMLAGQPPFVGTGVGEIIAKHLNTPPPPLSTLRPRIPPALEQPVLQALAKQPEQRPQSAGELAQRVSDAIAATDSQQGIGLAPTVMATAELSQPIVAPPSDTTLPPAPAPALSPRTPVQRVSPAGSARKRSGRSTKTSLGIVGGLLLIVVMFVFAAALKKRHVGNSSDGPAGSGSTEAPTSKPPPRARGAAADLLHVVAPDAQLVVQLFPRRLLEVPGLSQAFGPQLLWARAMLGRARLQLESIDRLLWVVPDLDHGRKNAPAFVGATGVAAHKLRAFAESLHWRPEHQHGYRVFVAPRAVASIALVGRRFVLVGEPPLVRAALGRLRQPPTTLAADLRALARTQAAASVVVRQLSAKRRAEIAKGLGWADASLANARFELDWDGTRATIRATLAEHDPARAATLRDVIARHAAAWTQKARGTARLILASFGARVEGRLVRASIHAPSALVGAMLAMFKPAKKKAGP
ncbi:MAG: protein kinase [Myxococcales bacterium]|nr:protein kinase [Myxococcales bacterium]